MKKHKIYIGGVAVFSIDPMRHFRAVIEICERLNFEALIPFDPALMEANMVYAYNMELIKSADGMVADFDPFRGSEPDSGVVWEASHMRAHNKPVVGYYRDARPMRAKVEEYFKIDPDTHPNVMPDNMYVESWGFPLNLMVFKGCETLNGGYIEALQRLREIFDEQAQAVLQRPEHAREVLNGAQ